MLSQTSTTSAPWYVMPADHKWFSRLAIAAVLVAALDAINPRYPAADLAVRDEMAQVANDLKVKLSGAPQDDTDIARAIAHVLEWMQVPEGKVQARVQDGWAMLEGEVEYEYQRHEVERMVR
ncbi:MAG: phosphate--nucleotide phosphotransferase [Actinomycetia bacterium]|nr:phosphate--nucleotide phosphotransferase [Actinomycetes bacterium]